MKTLPLIIILFTIFLVGATPPQSFSQSKKSQKKAKEKSQRPVEMTPQEWQGEFFKKSEGLFYINILLSNFPENKESQYLQTSVQFIVKNKHNRHTYTFSQAAYSKKDEDMVPTLWKLPEGEYHIAKVYLVDSFGTSRFWAPKKISKTFAIKNRTISNLGRWRVLPNKKNKLKVKVKNTPSENIDGEGMKYSQILKIINGYNGKTLKELNPENKKSPAQLIDKKKLSKSYTYTRTVSMFYKVNLFRHNKYSNKIAKIISIHDAKFRKCYTDVLELNERVKGKVKFKFSLSKETRSMKRIRLTYENVRETKLTNCLFRQLQDMRFSLPENMLGELTYSFDNY